MGENEKKPAKFITENKKPRKRKTAKTLKKNEYDLILYLLCEI